MEIIVLIYSFWSVFSWNCLQFLQIFLCEPALIIIILGPFQLMNKHLLDMIVCVYVLKFH
jgi:hypothetical protein